MTIDEVITKLRARIESGNKTIPESHYVFLPADHNIYILRDISYGDLTEQDAAAVRDQYKLVRAHNVVLTCKGIIEGKYEQNTASIQASLDEASPMMTIEMRIPKITLGNEGVASWKEILLDADNFRLAPIEAGVCVFITVNRVVVDPIITALGDYFDEIERNFEGYIVTEPVAYKKLLAAAKVAAKLADLQNKKIKIAEPSVHDERGSIVMVLDSLSLDKGGVELLSDLLDMSDGFSLYPMTKGRMNLSVSVNDVYSIAPTPKEVPDE